MKQTVRAIWLNVAGLVIPLAGIVVLCILYKSFNFSVHEQQREFESFVNEHSDKANVFHSIHTEFQSSHIDLISFLYQSNQCKTLLENQTQCQHISFDIKKPYNSLVSSEEYFSFHDRELFIFEKLKEAMHEYIVIVEKLVTSDNFFDDASIVLVSERHKKVATLFKLFDSATSKKINLSYDTAQSSVSSSFNMFLKFFLFFVVVLSVLMIIFYVLLQRLFKGNHALEEARLYAENMIQSIPDPVFVTDEQWNVVKINHSSSLLFACENNAIGKKITDILIPLDEQGTLQNFDLQQDVEVHLSDLASIDQDSVFSISCSRTESSQRGTEYIFVAKDISYRKRTEEELNYQANYDVLTGLPNRFLFNKRLQAVIDDSVENNSESCQFAVIFMDLDRFKFVNDTLGHETGDELLCYVAQELTKLVGDQGSVCRFGGDEFLIHLNYKASTELVSVLCKNILSEMSKAITVRATEIFIGASIGVSLYPDNTSKVSELILKADTAMYRAKNSGKNCFKFYTDAMGELSQRQLNLDTDLRHAIECSEFQVYYQPQVDLLTGKVVGAEALLRWLHPRHGLIPPLEFLGIAEESDVILSIGKWLLGEVLEHLNILKADNIPLMRVAINLSNKQFHDENLLENIVTACEKYKISPEFLEMELTETILASDIESCIEKMQSFIDLGMQVSIDDFGTGYSSLNYIKRFPIHQLKVDKSFIDNIAENSSDSAIVDAIVALSKELKLKVIAEGVETADQAQALVESRCYQAQGYLFSKPLPFNEFKAFLERDMNLLSPIQSDA